MFTVIALVCSLIATPDRADCGPSTAKLREVIGQVDMPSQCLIAAEQVASNGHALLEHRWDASTEYLKVMCVRTDLLHRG